MNKTVLLIASFGAALLVSGPILAKGKGQGTEKHQSQSRMENTNKQSLEDSRRGQERAEQRHEMHDQDEYGQPSYRIENPVNTLIDRSADQLKSGASDLFPPPQPGRR